jgi:nucleoside-diphosphate-sugar epimerase
MDSEQPNTVDGLRDLLEVDCRVLYSLPPISPSPWALLEGKAARLVYLSTTGVYGAQRDVDEHTLPAPESPREWQRIHEEMAASRGNWSWLVLRPAAIYGPGRGVHTAMSAGTHRLIGSGENYVSRIHVDDLAAHAEAGLLTEVSGAWPVADEEPCRALEIAEFCAHMLAVPLPAPAPVPGQEHETRRSNRRVNGQGIRKALQLSLKYPSYRVGIPAAVAEEEERVGPI